MRLTVSSPVAGRFRQSLWRHQMKTFSALLALCEGNPPGTGGFPSRRPVALSFDVFFDLLLHKQFSKQSGAGDLRRHRAHYDVTVMDVFISKWYIFDLPVWLLVGWLNRFLYAGYISRPHEGEAPKVASRTASGTTVKYGLEITATRFAKSSISL